MFKYEPYFVAEEYGPTVNKTREEAISILFKRYWGQFNTSCDMPADSKGFTCEDNGGAIIIRFTIMREYTIGPRIKEGGLCMMCMHFDGCTRPQHHNGPHRLPE